MTIEEFAERWAPDAGAGRAAARRRGRGHADRLRNQPAGLARALRGLGTGALPSLWDRLPEVRCRSTLIVGERDAKFQGDRRARWRAALPDAQVAVVPGAGHAVHLEAPERVAAAIAR